MTHWNLDIPDETDQHVRKYLQRKGESDLASFVDRAVRKVIFWETVDAVQEQNKDLSAEDAQRIADEAVADARANRP